MKVKELIKMEIDVDVYDSLTDILAIAFVGPLLLTEDGEKEFKEVLELEATLNLDNRYCIINCENMMEVKKCAKFFKAAAGYCSEENYNKWFEEN